MFSGLKTIHEVYGTILVCIYHALPEKLKSVQLRPLNPKWGGKEDFTHDTKFEFISGCVIFVKLRTSGKYLPSNSYFGNSLIFLPPLRVSCDIWPWHLQQCPIGAGQPQHIIPDLQGGQANVNAHTGSWLTVGQVWQNFSIDLSISVPRYFPGASDEPSRVNEEPTDIRLSPWSGHRR